MAHTTSSYYRDRLGFEPEYESHLQANSQQQTSVTKSTLYTSSRSHQVCQFFSVLIILSQGTRGWRANLLKKERTTFSSIPFSGSLVVPVRWNEGPNERQHNSSTYDDCLNQSTKSFGPAMRTGSARQFQRYPSTYIWVLTLVPFFADNDRTG